MGHNSMLRSYYSNKKANKNLLFSTKTYQLDLNLTKLPDDFQQYDTKKSYYRKYEDGNVTLTEDRRDLKTEDRSGLNRKRSEEDISYDQEDYSSDDYDVVKTESLIEEEVEFSLDTVQSLVVINHRNYCSIKPKQLNKMTSSATDYDNRPDWLYEFRKFDKFKFILEALLYDAGLKGKLDPMEAIDILCPADVQLILAYYRNIIPGGDPHKDGKIKEEEERARRSMAALAQYGNYVPINELKNMELDPRTGKIMIDKNTLAYNDKVVRNMKARDFNLLDRL